MVGFSTEGELGDRSDPAGQSLDVVYDLLTDQRRRQTLAFLADQPRPVSLADLARKIASQEHDRPSSEIPEEDIQAIKTSLYHMHLPKLENAGVVEHNKDTGTVGELDTADRVQRVRSFAANDGPAQ